VRVILGAAAALLAAGCATFEGQFAAHLASPSTEVRECAGWYRALDEQVEAAGVGDAQYTRMSGFPYLRVDRFLASAGGKLGDREPAWQAFVERLRNLDLASRKHEIDNLPRSQFDALPEMGADITRADALRRTRECGARLAGVDLANPRARAELLAAARVPDEYSSAQRLVGLYALTRIPFADGVRRWQDEVLASFRGEAPTSPGAGRVRFAPPAGGNQPRGAVLGLLARAQFDPLGQPMLSEREFELIAAAYAPSFDIAIAGDYDRFGALRWRREGAVPEVDAAEPVVYVQPAYTRYGERVLLQVVYTLWFPERPSRGVVDLLAGRLDGLVWRVTLAPDGEPLLYDSMHPCGCYHQFFPTPRARPRPAPDALEEWAFVPQSLPGVHDGEHPVVSIASATHYIERVAVARGAGSLVRYAFRPYDELRSLGRLDGGRRSAFGADGLIAGSERAERFLYWPMGIPSAGAMRQWGRHATAFVGRRHFDDADLIERRFELDLERGG
jgi:hypothetical protein